MSHHWYRLSIDLDSGGNPIGTSYEVRHSDRIIAIHTLPTPAPFSNPHDELELLATDIEGRYGTQLSLWYGSP